jgi:hypothetical protein
MTCCGLGVGIFVASPEPPLGALRFFVATFWDDVEIVVSDIEHVDALPIGLQLLDRSARPC